MAVRYKLVRKCNPSKPGDPMKFYANAISGGEVPLRVLLDEIAEISTVSQADTQAVIESLLHLIPKHLSACRIIRLGDFGSFGARLASNGAETEEDFTKSLIKGLRLYFRPGAEIRKALDRVSFHKD